MHIDDSPKARSIMESRFGRDSLIALATTDEKHRPWVRTVNAFYSEGSFYVITHVLSDKIRQIDIRPDIAICADWFTGRGVGLNRGHVLRPENAECMAVLRSVFSQWYENGHTDESDPNTVILEIGLTEGTLMSSGRRYDLEF